MFRRALICVVSCMLFGAGILVPVFGQEPATEPNEPKIAAASKDAELSISRFTVPEGMQTKLFAAEPLLANPVAFTIDAKGRFYVCETYRQKKGVEDNRSHGNWLETDLSLQTVEERGEMFRKFLSDEGASYTREQDLIRLVEDTTGDGKADASKVFAGKFHDLLDGTGAGVLVRGENVYYTCIPKLWLLQDKDDDGVAEKRTALHHGYGIRVAFRGHDMHGLVWGTGWQNLLQHR